MTRGKRRPRLLDYAKAAQHSAVEAASRAAFQALSGSSGGGGSKGSSKEGGGGSGEPSEEAVKQALAELCVLKVRAVGLMQRARNAACRLAVALASPTVGAHPAWPRSGAWAQAAALAPLPCPRPRPARPPACRAWGLPLRLRCWRPLIHPSPSHQTRPCWRRSTAKTTQVGCLAAVWQADLRAAGGALVVRPRAVQRAGVQAQRAATGAGARGSWLLLSGCLLVPCAVPKVLQLTAALRKKAAALSKAGGRQWTAKEVEQALYAASVGGAGGAGSSGGGEASGSGKKRKR